MKRNLLVVALVAMTLTSCKMYYANYDVQLASVESPADAKKQFGETQVVTFNDGEIDKYRYEDDFISIIWYVSSVKFNFQLTNKSNHTIKINWDDISYVDYAGKVGRVMHAGVKYNERNNSQPASTIPKGASIDDILLPTDNVSFITGQYGGWREFPVIPYAYETRQELQAKAPLYVGKTLKILMPIMIENVQNDYTFEFNIASLLNPKGKLKAASK